MEITFQKYEGTGNDFVIVHDPHCTFPEDPAVISRLCDRKFGIGADGLILIRPSEVCDYRMVYFNADGNLGSMCGNGARCTFHCARRLGIASDQARFEAYDGQHTALLEDQGWITVSIQDVHSLIIDEEACVLDTGSPHYVTFVRDILSVDVYSEGRTIRNYPHYMVEGINVNFIEVKSGELLLRTYERGVEDITLSCGTGATASVLAYATLHEIESGPVKVHTLGGPLEVDFTRKGAGGFEDITLSGPVHHVFQGQLKLAPIK